MLRCFKNFFLLLTWAVFVMGSCTLQGCSEQGSVVQSTAGAAQFSDTTLQTGDMIVRKGRGPISDMLAQLNVKDKSWSHCGMVVVRNGQPFVFHSIGGEDNPKAVMRCDSLKRFLDSTWNNAFAVYRFDFDSPTRRRVAEQTLLFYQAKPRFDMAFDIATDSALYCSELIYKIILRATHDTDYISRSVGYNRIFVGIDNLFLNRHATMVRKVVFK